MRYRGTWLGLIMAACVAVIIARPSVAKDLVYGSHLGPKNGINADTIEPLLKAIGKESGGSLNWRNANSGQVVGGRAALAGVRDRLIDATYIVPAYTRKELRHVNVIFDSMVFGENAVPATGATAEVILRLCPKCKADFHKQNAVFLSGYAATAFRLMCKKEVRSLKDLKGAKVRTVGVGTRLVRLMGAVPVAMSPPAGVTAMQRGAIDCTLGAVSWLQSYGYIDVVKYVIDYPLGIFGGIGIMVMNRDTWKSLTPAQKAAVLKHQPMAMARAVLVSYQARDDKIIAAAKAKGIVFTNGGAEFDNLVAEYKKHSAKDVTAAMRKLGVQDPGKIMAAYTKSLAKWQKMGIGNDVDKLAQAIKTEIYDKMKPEDF